ncbi:MAG: RNA polymerase sigma factor [Actinomycetota bacterium]
MRPLRELPDKDLVIAFQSGEPVAYDEIYKRHRPRVARICIRMLGDSRDAEEASQEAFLKAYQALGRFNGTYQLGAWLARIAANVCFDHLRARARAGQVVSLPFGHDVLDTAGPPEEVVIGRDPRIGEAIDQIQPLHARALKLRVLDGLSHKEMAGRLAMSPEQVKALLHRARTSFKKAWDKAEGWALAPILALRLGRTQTSDTGPQLVPVGQSFSPMLAERVAASAVMLAVALSGAPSSPVEAGTGSRPGREAPRAVADRPGHHHRLEARSAAAGTASAAPTARESKPSLLASVPAIPDNVRKAADPDAPKPPRDDDDDDLLPGPGTSQTRPVVKKTREAAEKVLQPQ